MRSARQFSCPCSLINYNSCVPGLMEPDPGEDNLSSRGWESGRFIAEAAGLSGSIEDELNKSQTSISYLDVDKDLDSKQELIDDKEFDIPQVDTPPTLESILNETDDEDEPFIPEDPALLNIETIDTHSCDTSSLASSDSGDRAHKRKKRLPDAFSRHGSVMRHTLLKGISAQIVSATDKVDADCLPELLFPISCSRTFSWVSVNIW
ncbi:hypothetical protein GDO81_017204 [Engystomops pustulosus]|uniref:Uncharacterized protein n=1 Tax=Engystomops pustulosus TaxID=76066 RepID=A0AAV7AHW2_ENGPU|nr:hypothetical protein GDO81_017204 [Engystomops pustulosus]